MTHQPPLSARAPSIAVQHDQNMSRSRSSEDQDEPIMPSRFEMEEEQAAKQHEELQRSKKQKASKRAARQRDKDIESLLSGMSGRTSPGPPKVDRDVAKLLRAYANVDIVSQAAGSDDDDEDELDGHDERDRPSRGAVVEHDVENQREDE